LQYSRITQSYIDKSRPCHRDISNILIFAQLSGDCFGDITRIFTKRLSKLQCNICCQIAKFRVGTAAFNRNILIKLFFDYFRNTWQYIIHVFYYNRYKKRSGTNHERSLWRR